jgi:hypothetical protein
MIAVTAHTVPMAASISARFDNRDGHDATIAAALGKSLTPLRRTCGSARRSTAS